MTEAEQNRLVIEHMELVAPIAAEFRGGDVEFEDLLGAGREGLVKAARSFDATKSKFSTRASTKIRSEIYTSFRTGPSKWYPKNESPPPFESEMNEKFYEYDAWGEIGNAMAIAETWARLGVSSEDAGLLYSEICDKRDRFEAAFISLTGMQRHLVKMVFLRTPVLTISEAARELSISRLRAGRTLKKALGIMREVLTRMEANTESGGNTANGRPPLTGLHGCVPGPVAA